ncbi:MAG: hypothetical protein HZA46_21835 [Planctomycetales bacterium]|nr:hypothetical protein [Planctomycetales bacterium]
MPELWPHSDARVPRLASAWFPGCDWQWSSSTSTGRRIAVVTSRLPRLIDPQATWLAALRGAVCKVGHNRSVLVVGHETAGEDLFRRAAHRVRVPFVELWESAAGEFPMESTSAKQVVVRVRPIPPSGDFVNSNDSGDWQHTPERDRAVIAWADEVIALRVRAGGNLHVLLRERLRAGVGGVLLADLPGETPQAVRDELVALGAELWSLNENESKLPLPFGERVGVRGGAGVSGLEFNASSSLDCPSPPAPLPKGERGEVDFCGESLANCLHALPDVDGWDFLTHTTRACPGAWPGQRDDDYFDSLLDGRGDADHSALGTLIRIVTQRRLRASNRLIRGGHGVVSFTAVPLVELASLHRYRGHLARWDFEPYGICLRREWLERRGARRVLYGGEAEWGLTPTVDQPFFQCVRELDRVTWNGGAPPDTIDWSAEREWRHLGDLDLSDVTPNDVLLFVPTRDAAQRLASVCPWPITIVNTMQGT